MKKNVYNFIFFSFFFLFAFLFFNTDFSLAANIENVCVNTSKKVLYREEEISENECVGTDFEWFDSIDFNSLKFYVNFFCFETNEIGSGFELKSCRSSTIYRESHFKLSFTGSNYIFVLESNPQISTRTNYTNTEKYLINFSNDLGTQDYKNCYNQEGELVDCNNTNICLNNYTNNSRNCFDEEGNSILCPFTYQYSQIIREENSQSYNTYLWNEDSQTFALTTFQEAALSNVNPVLEDIIYWINTINTFVLFPVLGAFLIIKGSMLGAQIVKLNDQPDQRQEKIRGLVQLFIGVAAIFVVLAATPILIELFKGFI